MQISVNGDMNAHGDDTECNIYESTKQLNRVSQSEKSDSKIIRQSVINESGHLRNDPSSYKDAFMPIEGYEVDHGDMPPNLLDQIERIVDSKLEARFKFGNQYFNVAGLDSQDGD